jgi:hypothetical protein
MTRVPALPHRFAWSPPDNERRMRPVQIGEGPSEDGPRLGGRPPSGVIVPTMRPECRYFATVPISVDPPLELSIFINREFESLIAASLGELINDDRVLLIPHRPSRRAIESPYRSELSEHPLVLGEECDDWFLGDDGDEVTSSMHKLGGRPHTIHDPPEFVPATQEAARRGLRQFIQFDFPGADDAMIQGSWPWGDGEFHVFFRGPLAAAEWACFWEF